MRLFDRFRKPDEPDNSDDMLVQNAAQAAPEVPPSPAQEAFAQAVAVAEQDKQAALPHLMSAFAADPDFAPTYELAARVLTQIGGGEEAALFEAARQNFNDFRPFFDLGYHFIDVQNVRLALPFLQRAHRLNPDDAQTACELAVAYAHQLQPEKGREALAQMYENGHFWEVYQFFWCCFLTQFEVDKIRDFVETYRAAFAARHDEASQGPVSALDKLDNGLRRYDALNEKEQGVPPIFIRDWHFIQYGAALLSFFDDNEGDVQVAGGRYVALWGQMESVAGILHDLVRFLSGLDRLPERLLYLPDRDSEIIGLALGSLLNVPPEEADDTNVGGPNRLIVAADSRELYSSALSPVYPSQTVFALNVHWTDDGAVTPDVGGVMTQAYYFPWRGENMTFDPETRTTSKSEEDTRPSFAIAAELAALPDEADLHFALTLAFYQKHAGLLMGNANTPPDGSVSRIRFIRDSPVPGSYFF